MQLYLLDTESRNRRREEGSTASLIMWVPAFQAKGLFSLVNFYLETKGFSENEERGLNDVPICISVHIIFLAID